MLRFLALTLLAYLVWQGIERLLDRLAEPAQPQQPQANQQGSPPVALARCVVCGVHFPAANSFGPTQPICSESCRQAESDP